MSKMNLEGNRLVLSGHLDLNSLMAYKKEIEQTVPANEELVVDLGGLEIEGSAVMALLVFMLRRSKGAGGTLRFESASERLVAMASLAGLVDLLGF
jgi:anti-anti-sigma factor